METRLLKTFAPMDDESGLGYYRRLSAANGLNGWKELARLSEVSGARTGLFSRPLHVASMLGIDAAACQMASAKEELSLGWRGLRRTGFDAVCPHCLGESVHLRMGWGHSHMVACPVHETLLVDKCGGCGQRLRDSREHLEYCDCGQLFPALATTKATDSQLWVAAIIVSRGASSGRWLPEVREVHPELFGLLVRNLCQLFDPELTVTRENAAAPRTVLEAVEFLRPLEYLLRDWPHGFVAHVHERIAFGPATARTLNTKLGKWYLRIREVGLDGPLNQFLETVHQVAAADYVGVLALDHVSRHEGRKLSHLMLADAAAQIGVHRATLLKAVQAGLVASTTRPHANRGVALEIPIEEVEAIVRARQAWVSQAQAREALNVPEAVYKYFVEAGLLVVDHSGRLDIRRGLPVELACVEKLRERLLMGPWRADDDGGSRLQLREFNARRLGDKKAIVRLLGAIAAGDVRAMGPAKTPGELEYLESDVAVFFSSKSVDAGLTVQALAKATGWKWESISHWIDLGLLESVPAVLRGQPCRVVMPEHLLNFTQSYVPLSTVARSLNARSSELLERLGGIELVGGKPLPSGAVRGALVRLGDLAVAALLPPLASARRTEASLTVEAPL